MVADIPAGRISEAHEVLQQWHFLHHLRQDISMRINIPVDAAERRVCDHGKNSQLH